MLQYPVKTEGHIKKIKGFKKDLTKKLLVLATCTSLASGAVLGLSGCEKKDDSATEVRTVTLEADEIDTMPLCEESIKADEIDNMPLCEESIEKLVKQCNEELTTTDLSKCYFLDKGKTRFGFELEDIDENLDTLYFQNKKEDIYGRIARNVGFMKINNQANVKTISSKSQEGSIAIYEKSPFVANALTRSVDGVVYDVLKNNANTVIEIYKKDENAYVSYIWYFDNNGNSTMTPNVFQDRVAQGNTLGEIISFDQIKEYEKEMSIYNLNREISLIDGIDFDNFTENLEMNEEKYFKKDKKEIYFENDGKIYKEVLNEIGDVDDSRYYYTVNNDSAESTYKKYIAYSLKENEDGGWTVNIYKQRQGRLFVFEESFDKLGYSKSDFTYKMYNLSTQKEYEESQEKEMSNTKL